MVKMWKVRETLREVLEMVEEVDPDPWLAEYRARKAGELLGEMLADLFHDGGGWLEEEFLRGFLEGLNGR